MARSKFPGKPSKPVNRTRINVLPSTIEDETAVHSNNELNQVNTLWVNTGNASNGLEITNGIIKNGKCLKENPRRTAKRKVCKSLMDRRNSLSRLKRVIVSSANVNLQKLKSEINVSQSNSNKRKRSEKTLSNTRKLKNKKQSRLESSNLVGKFVLPSRSVHSSRVIKPNKRFINVEAVSSVQLKTFKKRIVNKKTNPDNTPYKSKCMMQYENNSCKREPTKTFTQKSVDNNSRAPCSNRRIILRQARLQLHTQTPTGPEGPFSSTNNSSNVSPPGTVTCGVCGAVRFYRFVKQARKFNIYSCESCRKFISKMIKRQLCSKKLPDIQCLKGQGMCHVPPIVRSQHWKFRCAYKARCNACWLKMCLRSFQMPAALKGNLTKLLPEFMRESENLLNNSFSLFSFHTNLSIDKKPIPKIASATSPNSELQLASVRKGFSQSKVDYDIEKSNASDVKRQKLDLKGPRVKHVCRSASIVLGQPLAIFPDSLDKKQTESNDTQCKVNTNIVESTLEHSDVSENKENDSAIDNKSTIQLENTENSIETEQLSVRNNFTKSDTTSLTFKQENDKTDKQPFQIGYSVEAKTRKRLGDIENGICSDYWENYDPEEICKSGFSLTSSISFPMLAICFLCGSAGQEPLLYCCACCEPYHSFCLEQIPSNLHFNDQCYDWLCPRCTVCSECGEIDKQKVNCQKCHKTYHPKCFNNLLTDDGPMVCSSCLRCKNCGTNNITKFIGNTPLCLTCFSLRKKENFCPVCQKHYDNDDDNSYDTKLMECGKCNMWIHAECENLSDEQYQILSHLPETIQFLCCMCEPTPHWRQTIASELKANFNNILKLLSKNRTARDILKWSPTYIRSSTNKTAVAAKKLQFSDESDASSFSDNNDEIIDQENLDLKNIQKKYKLKELRVTLKPYPSIENEDVYLVAEDKPIIKSPITSSLTDLKSKFNSKEYLSLKEFNRIMEEILKLTKSTELLQIYNAILKQVFPWYNPNEFKVESKSSFSVTSHSDIMKLDNHLSMLLENSKYKLVKNIENDTRICVLCKGVGDGIDNKEARLLYCGNNEWIHANCALWSSEVYEEIDGSLQNVHNAIARGRLIRCTYCKQKGASIGCCLKSCHETYHFSCAHSVQCYFMIDKSVYCPSHDLIDNVAVISSPADFAIQRSVYVELDKKKKRYIDPKRIQFMVGSLCITNLGSIVPVVSDTVEALIPANISCKRLFWSTTEPWKLIPYTITSRVLNTESNIIITDRNFTVDHSLPKIIVEKKLKEVLMWQKEIEKTYTRCIELEDEEEPQNENATDILSPELTDAILEELPHEFLDGISMQDIFPKLMNNEELLGIDFKVTDITNNEIRSNDVTLQFNEHTKKGSIMDDVKEASEFLPDVKIVKELKDKSEMFQQLQSKVQNHQGSHKITLNCKVDNSPTKQKIKAVSPDKNVYLQLLQVDGAYDNSSSSDSESTSHEVEDLWIPEISDKPVKCERCQCTYRTQASYKRHLETCEEISTSESDSEMILEQPEQSDLLNTDAESTAVVETNADTTEPYVMSSFESYSAYQTTQNEVHSTVNAQYISSQSAAEMVAVPQTSELLYSTLQTNTETQNPTLFSQDASLSINQSESSPITSQPSSNSICESTQVTVEGHSLQVNETNELCVNQTPSLYISQPNCNTLVNQPNAISFVESSPLPVTPASISINQTGAISLNTSSTPLHINQPIKIQSQQFTIQSIPMTQGVNPILNITPSNQISLNNKMLATPNIVAQTVAVPQSQIIPQKTLKLKSRPRSLAVRNTHPFGTKAVLVPQNISNNPSVIVQQLPSTNMIPNFLEAFQHQAGQNLQYITTIAPQITPALSTQPQIVQLQPEGTLVNLVSGVQPAVILPQPRVLGDQLIVDNNGSLVWTPQPVQPIFYGFETIVQNTVLQSQQFLPSTVPGVLTANSSYSSTTQVFQTSKLEPMLDVTSGNIMLLNSSPVVNSQPFQISNNVSNQISASPLVISESKPSVSLGYIETSRNTSSVGSQLKTLPMNVSTITNNLNSNSINLPKAPFISESGIPTNRVTPTPKLISTATTQARPMNRVLPMRTNNLKQNKPLVKNLPTEKEIPPQKIEENKNHIEKKSPKITVLDDIIIKPLIKPSVQTEKVIPNITAKEEATASLKLVFQKQSEGGIYKINNSFNMKNSSSVQIVPLKPMKPKNAATQQCSTLESNILEKEKISNLSTHINKQALKSERKLQQENSMLYTVETKDGFHYSSTSMTELWTKVFEAVQSARLAHNMPPLPNSSLMISGLQIIGLKSNGLKYLLEQLPGAGKCVKYKPHFHTQTQETDLGDDLELIHPSGTARTRPHVRCHEPTDMFGWLASKHRKPPLYNPIDFEQNTRRGSVTNLPMPMRFRQLKLTYKQSVGVYRSRIHKRGLFCHRDIESGEMVIEYAGEVIRSVLADKREKQYTVKGMGCYMFRIDENFVVDATMKGNAARFINHSCEPNCYSKVVEILGHKHIIIFALRKILCGEELTYDYKFPFEEDKIPCTCSSRRCRKFLN